MSRALAAVVVAVLAAVAPAVAPAAPLAPETLTLRLPDVGLSYELGSSRCGSRTAYEEGEWPSELPGLSARFPHHGCVIAFGEGWRVPGAMAPPPSYVMSAAYVFADAAGPEAALRRPRSIAARILDGDRRDFAPLPVGAAIGDETRLLRLDGYPLPGIVVLWRSGPVVGLVLAADRKREVPASEALRLATAQQARIATPTRLLVSDLDDVEVPLDNPRLGVPVQWLGRELPAHGTFPALRLDGVDGPDLDQPRLEPRAGLYYTHHVTLALWQPRAIRRLLRNPRLHRLCVRTHDARVEGVDATLVAYPDPVPRDCAGSRPNTWTAAAFLPGVAVTIEVDACYGCRRRGAYESPAGLRTIIRTLRLRAPLAGAPAPPPPASAPARPAPPAAASAPTAARAGAACRA